jgi:hypothetical protein
VNLPSVGGTPHGGLGGEGAQSICAASLLRRVQALAARMPHLGVGPDLARLGIADLIGVYRFLKRESGSGE